MATFDDAALKETFILIHDFLTGHSCSKTAKSLAKEAPSSTGLSNRKVVKEDSKRLLELVKSAKAGSSSTAKEASSSSSEDSDSDSDESSDADDDEVPAKTTRKPTAAGKYAAVPPPRVAETADSKSALPKVNGKSTAAVKGKVVARTKRESSSDSSDADSESSSDEDESAPSKIARKAKQAATTTAADISRLATKSKEKVKDAVQTVQKPPLASSSSDESDSSEESSSDDEPPTKVASAKQSLAKSATAAVSTTSQAAKKAAGSVKEAASQAKSMAAATKSSSSSSSSSSASSDSESSDSDSDSDSISSQEAAVGHAESQILPPSLTAKAAKVANAVVPAANGKRKAASSSDSSSSTSSSDSSSSSSSDEEDVSTKPPPTKKRKASFTKITTTVQLPASEAATVQVSKRVEHIIPASTDVSASASPAPSSNGNMHPSRAKRLEQQNKPFRRVKVEDHQVDARLKDNSFLAKSGAHTRDYGYKAAQDLIVTRGDSFRKEKNKKKRGSYRGGEISMASNSIKFD